MRQIPSFAIIITIEPHRPRRHRRRVHTSFPGRHAHQYRLYHKTAGPHMAPSIG